MFIMCHASISLCLKKLINYVVKCTLAFIAHCTVFYCHPCIYATYMDIGIQFCKKEIITLCWIWYNYVFVAIWMQTLWIQLGKCWTRFGVFNVACTKCLCTIYVPHFYNFYMLHRLIHITFPHGAITCHFFISCHITHYNWNDGFLMAKSHKIWFEFGSCYHSTKFLKEFSRQAHLMAASVASFSFFSLYSVIIQFLVT
jgi:hypothetical protein